MNARDLFGLYGRTAHYEFDTLAESYWYLEMRIADENDAAYSNLELGDPQERTCQVCGTVCQTTESGILPRNCDNSQCAGLRDFWGVQEFPAFQRLTYQGLKKKRADYLKSRLQMFFGCTSFKQIPNELRFDFLLTAMVERVAYEKNN